MLLRRLKARAEKRKPHNGRDAVLFGLAYRHCAERGHSEAKASRHGY